MALLAPFEPAATCPKCGHDDVTTGYRSGAHYPCYEWGEHLDRICRRCHHSWPQRCIDRREDETDD